MFLFSLVCVQRILLLLDVFFTFSGVQTKLKSWFQQGLPEVLAKAQKGVLSTEGILVPALPLMVKAVFGCKLKRNGLESCPLIGHQTAKGPKVGCFNVVGERV